MIEELEWGGVAQYHRELEAYQEWMKNDYIARVMLLSSMQMISWSHYQIFYTKWEAFKETNSVVCRTRLHGLTLCFETY